ncbi:MAG: cryptochrome/photolyase family protein [Bdellovibrionota bacterium]
MKTIVLSPVPNFQQWAKNKKSLVMEFFYREMRKKTGLLMDQDKPLGGKWNFDQQNRKKWKKGLHSPRGLFFHPMPLRKR